MRGLFAYEAREVAGEVAGEVAQRLRMLLNIFAVLPGGSEFDS